MLHEADGAGTSGNQRARDREPDRMSPCMAWQAIKKALHTGAIISAPSAAMGKGRELVEGVSRASSRLEGGLVPRPGWFRAGRGFGGAARAVPKPRWLSAGRKLSVTGRAAQRSGPAGPVAWARGVRMVERAARECIPDLPRATPRQLNAFEGASRHDFLMAHRAPEEAPGWRQDWSHI